MIYEIAHLEGLIDIDTVNKFRQNNDIFKSWSTDLMQQFPNGSWKTINGAKVFVNGGKVIAGLNNFNGMIDEFFESKGKKESGDKNQEKPLNLREIRVGKELLMSFKTPDGKERNVKIEKKNDGWYTQYNLDIKMQDYEFKEAQLQKLIDSGAYKLKHDSKTQKARNIEGKGQDATKDPDKVEPAKKINVIPNGNTAFDKQAQSNIKNFLGKVKTKDRIKFANNSKEYDMFAVMDSKGDILKLTKSPQEAYQTALNSDIEDFHVVREKRDENEISYDYFNGSLFGDYDGEKYDKSGNLKQEVKDSVIKEMSSHFKTEQKPVGKETEKKIDKPSFLDGYWNGKIYGNEKSGFQIYVDEKKKNITNEQKKQLDSYMDYRRKVVGEKKAKEEADKINASNKGHVLETIYNRMSKQVNSPGIIDKLTNQKEDYKKAAKDFFMGLHEDRKKERTIIESRISASKDRIFRVVEKNSPEILKELGIENKDQIKPEHIEKLKNVFGNEAGREVLTEGNQLSNELDKLKRAKESDYEDLYKKTAESIDDNFVEDLKTYITKKQGDSAKKEAVKQDKNKIIDNYGGGNWNGKVYGKSGSYAIYLKGNKVEISDEHANELNKSELHNINTMENDQINKALLTLEIGHLQGKVDNETIEKARQAKYFKREGTPGNYKYYYTKEEYNRAKGGQQTEIHHGKEKEETGGKSKAVQKVLQLMDSEEDGQNKYRQYVDQVVKEMGVKKEDLEKELSKYI